MKTIIDYLKVDEMAEGDNEFRNELLEAIYHSIEDLRISYQFALATQNLEAIQQARHKVKPSLYLFGLDQLADILQKGKEMMESDGFSDEIELHRLEFIECTDALLSELAMQKP
ncbi:hypothetical protein [Pararhodonellum marinum]|uniref:hypothetical protein n=1 Tax=Pararhodonellum marinum TaxID=2755358 RepID=UPI00188FA8CC|nr:hypothetical protein [Pararhodonellum marinum]